MTRMSVQEKIADLERRILVLEGDLRRAPPDVDREWRATWSSFDRLMAEFDRLVKKTFRREERTR